MNIKKDDNVVITKGKDRGETGRVIKAFPAEKRVIVEEANFVKKRTKPKKKGEEGKTVRMEAPIPVSNVKLICGNCGKGVRVGYEKRKGGKIRVCKQCGEKV